MRACASLVVVIGLAAAMSSAADLRPQMPWRGVHVLSSGSSGMPLLERLITEVMPQLDLNVLVLEVDYGFAYQRHPEVAEGNALTAEQAKRIATLCRAKGIRLIPQFQCLGHQSWSKHTGKLLTAHPEFDETPNLPADNPGIYCRSWCPLHPQIVPFVNDLLDELLDAFGADALHVGMDEVFILGDDKCPRCHGKDKAELFAQAVNDLHTHLVGQRKVEMLMWGDRLLNGRETGYGEWEAATNGTAPAIDRVPKDIVLCDWHYEQRKSYPSIDIFLQHGFRVWPTGWRDVKATLAFIEESAAKHNPRMLGHLFSTWVGASEMTRQLLGGPGTERATGDAVKVAHAMKLGAQRIRGDALDAALLEDAALAGDAQRLLVDVARPPGGKLLASVEAKALAAGLTKAPGWGGGGWPHDAPRAVVLNFPGETPSQAGAACAVAFKLTIPADVAKPALQLYLHDTLLSKEWTGYRWYRLKAGAQVLWQEDLALDRSGHAWTTVPLTGLTGEVALTLEVVDLKGVANYATTLALAGVRLVDAP